MKWQAFLFALLVVGLAVPAGAVDAAKPFSMKPYKKECDEAKRPYASCVDQTALLEAGLAEAKAQGKRAVVVFGFNDCAPCNVLNQWLETEEGMLLLEPYVLIKVSIFTPERELRPEVYETLIPRYNLPINNAPPFGVPHLVVIDPETDAPRGEGLIGFNYQDQTEHIAYLQQYAGVAESPVMETD